MRGSTNGSVHQVTHEEAISLLHVSWRTKDPMILWGPPAIGKSDTVRSVARSLAQCEGREYVEWNSFRDKAQLFQSPEKYFVLADHRLTYDDGTMMKGTPAQVESTRSTVWFCDEIIRYASLSGSMGILFLDEFNLATTLVQNTAQQLLLDHCVGDTALSPDWLVVAAANRQEDRAFVHETSTTVNTRMATHAELLPPSSDAWCEWAANHGIDGRIIAFIAWKPSALYRFDPKSKEKAQATPRTYEFLSRKIQGVEDTKEIMLLSATTIGPSTGAEFTAFVRINERIPRIEDVLDGKWEMKPEDEISLGWAVVGSIAEYYKQHKSKDVLGKIIDLCADEKVPDEFQVLLMRMVKGVDERFFRAGVTQMPRFYKLAPKISKLVPDRK